MKGIILSGGHGTRLFPASKVISKQMMPIYDKPMIYYPLSVLMLAGIREILIITKPEDEEIFKRLMGDGSKLGINISYQVQKSPDGIAQAFILGKDFIGDDCVCLILGDNIYFGNELNKILNTSAKITKQKNKASILSYYIQNPERYGVIEFDSQGKAKSIKEKPKNPKSNYVVTGLYFYPNDVIQKAYNLKFSKRGELEISSINKMYLNEGRLNVELMGRGFTWLDAGTPDSFIEASLFVQAVEKRQGLKIACIEEIAFKKGYISKTKLLSQLETMDEVPYNHYLREIINSN